MLSNSVLQRKNYVSLIRFAILVLLVAAPMTHARYMRPDLVDVPIGRLITNIETQLKENPDDATLLHHLARAHAMAYAKNLSADDTVQQNKKRPDSSIWFGYQPPHVPYGRYRKATATTSAAAKEQLSKALAAYEKALAAAPKDVAVRLGRGWCAKEAGKTELAKQDFRAVIEEAWQKEGKGKGSAFHNYVSAEAIGYLKPLLDPKADAKELADYAERLKVLASFPRAMTPIAVPLADDLRPAAAIDRGATVAFDLDGTGRPQRWQWLKPHTAAWLVHDPSASGKITSALQLFGNRSFNLFHDDGYAAMRLLDDNGDGVLRGPELAGLALWSDNNADGISSPGEIQSLHNYQVIGLSCLPDAKIDGFLASRNGIEFRDGSTRPTWDLVLKNAAKTAPATR